MIKDRTRVRTLCAGAGLALAAGLLIGAAMRPDLIGGDRPAGPQILTGWSGVRAARASDEGGVAFAGYRGEIPDYVLGTDWRKMIAPSPATAEQGAPLVDEGAANFYESPIADDPPEPKVAAEAYAEPAAAHAVIPSLDGGAAYEPASRAENTPQLARADLDSEAPPEATGDTRPAAR